MSLPLGAQWPLRAVAIMAGAVAKALEALVVLPPVEAL